MSKIERITNVLVSPLVALGNLLSRFLSSNDPQDTQKNTFEGSLFKKAPARMMKKIKEKGGGDYLHL